MFYRILNSVDFFWERLQLFFYSFFLLQMFSLSSNSSTAPCPPPHSHIPITHQIAPSIYLTKWLGFLSLCSICPQTFIMSEQSCPPLLLLSSPPPSLSGFIPGLWPSAGVSHPSGPDHWFRTTCVATYSVHLTPPAGSKKERWLAHRKTWRTIKEP